LTAIVGDAVEVRSAGTVPARQVNPVAVAATAEVGTDLAAAVPKCSVGQLFVRRGSVVEQLVLIDSTPSAGGVRQGEEDATGEVGVRR
jgi:arsenate reductase (thioredoxin)